MWIDSHCHLDSFADISAVLQQASVQGVRCFLSIAVGIDNFQSVLPLSLKFPQVCATAGVHPCYIKKHQLAGLKEWLTECAHNPKVVGLGETGLDLGPSSPDLGEQINFFQVHVDVAVMTGLPLIVHLRDAWEPFLQIVRGWKGKGPKGVLHCFTGPLDVAQEMIDLGWKVSFSGIVTFKKTETLQQVVQALPLGSFVVETDAPWLAPVPLRGKENCPSYLPYTAQKIAELKGVSESLLAQSTTQAFFDLFPKTKPYFDEFCISE